MRRIGMLGGMSWESSLEYYRIINEEVKTALGGTHSADCVMYSFDFHEVEVLQHEGKWQELTEVMVEEAIKLKGAGAECIVICTNTMHKMAPEIVDATGLKVVHIAEATAEEILKRKISKVLLLGTRFTMEGTFYREKLEARNVEVVIPSDEDRQIIHDVIYDELVKGEIKGSSKKAYLKIINKMVNEAGIEGVVLGCTEIPLLVKKEDLGIEVLDTTLIHAMAAVEYALKKQ